MIKVVCGIIYKNDKIFICRRKKNKALGGFWEFPGGKIEHGESHKDCIKRELIEELKMQVEVTCYFNSTRHNYEDFSIELIAYKCNLIKWDSYLTEHDRYEWIQPKDILDWNLAPADIPLAKKLMEGK